MPDFIMDAAHKPPTIRRRDPKTGRSVIEKIPQTARNRDRSNRWIHMLDHCGNDLRVVVTTAAAEVRPAGKYKDRKAYIMSRQGWFPYGKCPMALIANGELNPSHLAPGTLEINDGAPCPHGEVKNSQPCKHTLFEQAERQRINAEEDEERQQGYKSEAERLLEKNAQANTKTLAGLSEAVGTLAQAVASNQVAVEPVDPEPPKAKGKAKSK